MDLSEKMKLRRQELNLTQQQVADKVFVTRQTISKWELGKSQPDLISLKLLDSVLHIHTPEDDYLNDSKGVTMMNQKLSIKDLVFTLIFGVLFLPLRLLYTLNQHYKNSRVLTFLIKPLLLTLFLLYVSMLNVQALAVVIGATLGLYYILNIYYSEEPSSV